MAILTQSLLLVLGSFVSTSVAAELFVSTNGTENGDGSIGSPLNSIHAAVESATPGTTIYLREGTYSLTTNVQIDKSGTADEPYVVSAYESEKVIIDGEELPGTPAPVGGDLDNPDRGIFHIEGAEFWEFYDLELINGPYGIYSRDSSNNYYERLITRDNYESGFQLEGDASNNTVLYLDSYGNRDPRKNGESADGFACKEGSGEGNVLRGARLWNNVDDGLDLWEFKSKVEIHDTLAWGNGINRWDFEPFEGDGNGFKLGGGGDEPGDIGPADHVITNCFSFSNAVGGFVDNSQTGEFTLTRNTAYNNGGVGFKFGSATATLTSNVAAGNSEAEADLSDTQVSKENSWDGDDEWSDSSFESVDETLVQGARGADGKIVASDFLIPVSGDAIGATTEWE